MYLPHMKMKVGKVQRVEYRTLSVPIRGVQEVCRR